MTTRKNNLTKAQRDEITAMLNGETFKLFCLTISARADEKQIEAINDEGVADDTNRRGVSAEAAKAAAQEYRTFMKVVAEARRLSPEFFLIEILPSTIN